VAAADGLTIEVRLRRDRLVIGNPGGLYGITVDRLGQDAITSARNARLVAICQHVYSTETGARAIEALATGIPIVTEAIAEAGLPPSPPVHRFRHPVHRRAHQTASSHHDEMMRRYRCAPHQSLSQAVAGLIRRGLGTGTPGEIAKSPRTGLPVAHLGRTITTEDVRQLEDDDQ